MGCEIASPDEWNHDTELPWDVLSNPENNGIHSLIRDLNRLYRSVPALAETDHQAVGFQWINADDADHSIYSFQRRSLDGNCLIIVVLNLTPATRHHYQLPVTQSGNYNELLNTDSEYYGGSNQGNLGTIQSVIGAGGPILELTVPPLAAIYLEHAS
jgi:1,4-alpha-glucan branching enzyme